MGLLQHIRKHFGDNESVVKIVVASVGTLTPGVITAIVAATGTSGSAAVPFDTDW